MGCPLFRDCLPVSIEVNGRTVGTFRIVSYIMGVRCSGVSVKRGSTVNTMVFGSKMHYNNTAVVFIHLYYDLMQAPDGANAIVFGSLSGRRDPLAFVGGNCSIHGVDWEGEDQFWTVSDCVCVCVCACTCGTMCVNEYA